MSKNTLIFKNIKNIILPAPADTLSGGPELMHQLCHSLLTLGHNAYIAYYTDTGFTLNSPTPAAYEKYNVSILPDLSLLQQKDSLLIIPETAIPFYLHYPNCQKCIWWLSVDNYIRSYEDKIAQTPNHDVDLFQLKNDEALCHLVQSEYAKEFLLRDMKIPPERIDHLSDYLNSEFFKIKIAPQFKQNFIAFNPKKGFAELKPIIDATPHFRWIPIMNMKPSDVANLLRLSKVYIDFGNHPGKDRIPREAAISGCCIITNKKGSAAFYEDVPIPENYKFENSSENPDEIVRLIQDIFNDYQGHYQNFTNYCDRIISEENRFLEDVKRLFPV